jgi:hypothetical protein
MLPTRSVRSSSTSTGSASRSVSEPVVEPWSTYVTLVDPDGWQFVVGGAK